ncbi:MAG: HAD-IC family P-type ATPase, partial [Oscillospiraceae bacterium]
MKPYSALSSTDALQRFNVTTEGLSAEQAAKNTAEYGENKLTEGKRKSIPIVFLEQFKDLLVVILIAAAVISMLSGNVESTIVILAVIILNAMLGTVQHFKAEKSLDSLKALSSPNAKVIRGGEKSEIASAGVVPGDIVVLEAGDLVVADGRIISNYSLQVNESSLTGESEAVTKHSDIIDEENIPLGDRKNMVYSGSLVTYGRAVMLVTATGMNTEIGKIAALMNQTQQKKTPLQVSLDDFSKRLAMVVMGICVLVFGLNIYRQMPILDSLMFAVALAVAAIPEALSSIVTIVLAIGTQKMAKENAIIKDLKAVESLGAVSVICSDKTGTLTQNKMTAQQVYTAERLIDGDELDIRKRSDYMLITAAVLANDSTSVDGKSIGDPTEVALVNLGHELGIEEGEYRSRYPRISELAFDSDRKLMSTLHNIDDRPIMLTKGALDMLLPLTKRILTENGVRAITDDDIIKIKKINEQLSLSGLRVLSFAYRELEKPIELTLRDEQNFTFIGLISMVDPPREESAQAVADAKRCGIKTIMITGDHKITASSIAKKIGIMEVGDTALDGIELDAMSDDELSEKLASISVYARVSPEHKIRIVNSWQKRGCIVSMT